MQSLDKERLKNEFALRKLDRGEYAGMEVPMIALVAAKNIAEYFCWDCGQLRLDLKGNIGVCGNCGGTSIIRGPMQSLDKERLKNEFALRKLHRY